MTGPEKPFELLSGEDAAKRYTFEEKRMYLQSGILGRLFGSVEAAPMNISGLVMVLLVGSAVGMVLLRGIAESVEFLKLVIPVITLILGYLFGKKLCGRGHE